MSASKVPSRTVDKYDFSTRIIPGQKAFSLFTRRSNHPAHPRIQAKRQATARALRRRINEAQEGRPLHKAHTQVKATACQCITTREASPSPSHRVPENGL